MTTLKDIIQNTAPGFAAGLAYGLLRQTDTERKALEVATKDPELLDIAETTPDKIREKIGRTYVKDFTWPAIFASAISWIDAVRGNLHSPELLGNFAGAYLGSFVGAGINRFRRRKIYSDLRRLEECLVAGDVSKLLTPEQRGVIDRAYDEFESEVASTGNDQDIIEEKFAPIYRCITNGNPVFTPWLLKWSIKNGVKFADRGRVQWNLKHFYESPIIQAGAACAVIGEPQEPKTTAYIREADSFLVQSIEWNGLRQVHGESGERKVVLVNYSAPKITTQEMTRFPSYRDFADLVLKNGQDSYFLFSSVKPLHPNLRSKLLTEAFTIAYKEVLEKRSGEKSNDPREKAN